MAVLLALACSLVWGTSDFVAGVVSKRLPPAAVVAWSQAIGLLVLTALDEVTDLNATVVGTEADTHVECSCAGVEPGRTYTARQILEAVLLMSGNDAANALADMIGGCPRR